MKSDKEKLDLVVEDNRFLTEQADLVKAWVKHLRTHKQDKAILLVAYTMREFALFIKKPFENAVKEDIEAYINTKSVREENTLKTKLSRVKRSSISGYKYRIHSFYRWILKHTDLEIDNELAYPTPKIIKKDEKSKEELCEKRVLILLENSVKPLDDKNIKVLRDFHNFKIASGKVESYTGFVTKIFFLKRLGLYLKKINKSFDEASREDIQGFLNEVHQGIKIKKNGNGSNGKMKINSSYKAHLLDFFRFVYGMFGEEQPRKYPEVVSWLYQKRKKSHDKLPKEIIPDKEIKLMIEKSTELRDKALIALMADCSGRVGEIININIGDVKINEIASEGAKYKHAIATVVLRGKTGERTNQLFSSVSYLRLWLLHHPLKDNPEAPLFIATKESRYGQRLTAVGINKVLQRAARRAGIKRHIHAHLFRHSNLTKMARILSESELKIHAGWGNDSKMASVYVHLNEKDVANKILQKYGLVPKEETMEENALQAHICPNSVCSYQNPGDAQFCLKCGYPLSLKTAVSLAKIKEKEDELQQELMTKNTEGIKLNGITDMREAMYQILKSDPKMIDKLREIVKLAEGATL